MLVAMPAFIFAPGGVALHTIRVVGDALLAVF